MLDTLLSGPFVPFTLSLALLFALLALEVVFLLIGGSLMGDGSDVDGPEIADGPDLDMDLDLDVELEAFDLESFDIDTAEFDVTAAEDIAVDVPQGVPNHPLHWLGLGRMPTLIWLASIFLSFGVSGVALQGVATTLLGGPLPAGIAVIPCAIVAIWFTARFGAIFARLLPKTETQSVSARQLGRRKGIVTQGTSARGAPAEVRVTDRYGNTHYIRAEPMKDADVIPQGAEVLVLRHRPTGGFRLIAL
ncbi:OB-fold-containig protein [Hasllibacter sp. MH4015]|uniref:OB-fold-containig protein n=1 Tax=Hasllibacter sp. MH4015 TaxID=2854029 RepID=UPI001CD2B4F6|nr:OB-fold-containig protein [Hasllibacter sp. MH4015]